MPVTGCRRAAGAAATAVAVAVAAAHHHDRIYWRRPCAPTPILFLQRYTYAGPGNDDDDDEAHETALLTKCGAATGQREPVGSSGP